ncbi:MAG: hypothetical protein ACC650_05815 [Gammaproteobacteria bacterium]
MSEMRSKSLIYVMRKFEFATVSQVADLLLHYQEQKIFDKIFLLISSMTPNKSLANQLDRLRADGIQIHIYKDRPFIHRKLAFTSCRSIFRILKDITADNESTDFIIHARSALIAYFAMMAAYRDESLKNIPILADFRGTEWAEYMLFTHMTIPVIREVVDAIETRELLLVEKQVYETVDAVSAVSPDFKKYLEMMWGPNENLAVNPCLARIDLFRYDINMREQGRADLGMHPDDIVVLFSTGGASPWQNIQEITTSFSKLKEKYESLKNSLKLLILTPAADKFTMDDDAITITSAAPHEMNKWLNIADIGIIFRDRNIVNYVASPIKISEYICTGLPLLTNSGVPMAIKWVEDTGYGAIVEDLFELEEDALAKLKLIDREAISSLGQTSYGLPSIASSYQKIYSTLLQNKESR